jgi:hypothetical protein
VCTEKIKGIPWGAHVNMYFLYERVHIASTARDSVLMMLIDTRNNMYSVYIYICTNFQGMKLSRNLQISSHSQKYSSLRKLGQVLVGNLI